jgi:hypothetical protein
MLLQFLIRLTALAFFASFPVAGMAQVAGTGPICDTAEQLEKVVVYANESRNFEASLQRVNAEQKQEANACAVAAVVFFEGERGRVLDTPDGKRVITKITVVAFIVGGMAMRVPPIEQYTLMAVPGQEA